MSWHYWGTWILEQVATVFCCFICFCFVFCLKSSWKKMPPSQCFIMVKFPLWLLNSVSVKFPRQNIFQNITQSPLSQGSKNIFIPSDTSLKILTFHISLGILSFWTPMKIPHEYLEHWKTSATHSSRCSGVLPTNPKEPKNYMVRYT